MFFSKFKSVAVFSFLFGLLALFFVPVSAASAQEPLVFTATPNAVVSDAAPVVSTINVPTAVVISKVTVAVSIDHTHAGDLQMTLTHDDTGTTITLLTRANGPGFAFGCGSNGIFAAFDDAAPVAMDNYDCSVDFESPITGVWKPTMPLATFNGQLTAGNWTLRVTDVLPTDNGVLNSWSIIFNTAVPAADMVQMMQVFVPPCTSFVDGESNPIFQFDAPDSIRSSIYCKLIAAGTRYIRTPGEIGIQSVIDMGIIHAVDIYSPLNTDYTAAGSGVCFRGQGSVIFLGASGIPRQPQALAASVIGNQTCAILPEDGTVILIGQDAGLPMVDGGSAMGIAHLDPSHRFLDSCRITTNYMLNIREQPGMESKVLDMVPYQINLQATERTRDWIRVVYLDFQGWLHADYLETQGDCRI